MPKILIVEDDIPFGAMLSKFLDRHGYSVDISSNASDSRSKFKHIPYDLVLCDLRLPDGEGLALLTEIKKGFPDTQIVLMTGYAEVDSAVSAMKKGAFDYISKPFTPDEMLRVVNKALESSNMAKDSKKENTPVTPPSAPKTTERVIGIGHASKQLEEHISLVAPTDMSVLIMGESGTGKEITAKKIHSKSKRRDNRFVAIDCGAIPKELATSEFFGHIKGSFTGAINDKSGYFEEANGGTIFLDEIGNLTYENQVQLLRAIQERKVKRLGSTKEIGLDVRIIAATNEDLQAKVDEGGFREDLYHRLNEFSITIPPLRKRTEDLMEFAKHFLNEANAQLDKSVLCFSQEVTDIFESYSWPGNLRELKNIIKRAVLLSEGDKIEVTALPKQVVHPNNQIVSQTTPFSKSEFEKDRILRALKQSNFNKTKAAKLLEITRKTLYNKIEHYGLEV